jgi:hypothetical protein
MTIERHDDHPPGTICRPAGNGLCEPLGPSKVPDLRGVPLGVLPAPGGDEGPTFGSGI